MTKGEARSHIVALDGLRGIAAISVMLGHIHFGQKLGLFTHSGLAVDFFLFLSGFVISLAYQRRLETGMQFREFMLARVLRLYPMIAVGTLVGMAFAFQDEFIVKQTSDDGLVLFRVFALHMLMIPFATPGMPFLLNFVWWSLFWELVLNALHALSARWLTQTRTLVIFALSLAGLAWVAKLFGTVFVGFGNEVNFLAGGLRLGFCYLGGILTYQHRNRISDVVPALPFPIVALGLFALLAMPVDISGPIAGLLTLGFALPLMLALGVKAKGARVGARALGILSYPLYAIHAPIVNYVQSHLVGATIAPFAVIRLATIGLLLVTSYCLGRWVDLTLVHWARNRKAERHV